MWRRWSFSRQLKLFYIRFIRIRGAPEEIAEGMALGIFIGMTPTMGAQILIAVFFAALLRKNKIAAALGVFITNPVTAPLIYGLQYELGRYLLGWKRLRLPTELSWEIIRNLSWGVIVPLCVGSLIFAVVFGLLAYFLTLKAIPVVKRYKISRWPRRRRRIGPSDNGA
ncbi:MAG: DUF2062 domain-containing protein [Deltaproteobacteria bacterium]|nr:DUF2062 domain-containing protein [Deltaproteobacteria bacterium]